MVIIGGPKFNTLKEEKGGKITGTVPFEVYQFVINNPG